MRIAYLSPLPPQNTGVSDYSEELLPHLASHAEIDLYADGYSPSKPGLRRRFLVRHYKEFPKHRHEYHACLYHLGNDLSHEPIFKTMLAYPSFAVLHEPSLHPLVVAMTVGHGDLVGYMKEMGYCYGGQGVAEARAAYVGRYYRYDEYPILERVVDVNLGVIVHSQYAARMVRATRPAANLTIIPQGTLLVRARDQGRARQRLGLDPEEFLLAFLGFVTPNKRLEMALRAFARLREGQPCSRFLIVGEVAPWYDLGQIIDELNLRERVTVTGRVPLADFYDYAAAADLCVALRYPTSGETSGALLRVMAVGRPVIVSDMGSFSELPEDSCIKVLVGDGEEDQVFEAMRLLSEDPARRRELGKRARHYVNRSHSWPVAARAYSRFIRETLAGLWSGEQAS